jgi:hypothetical protein
VKRSPTTTRKEEQGFGPGREQRKASLPMLQLPCTCSGTLQMLAVVLGDRMVAPMPGAHTRQRAVVKGIVPPIVYRFGEEMGQPARSAPPSGTTATVSPGGRLTISSIAPATRRKNPWRWAMGWAACQARFKGLAYRQLMGGIPHPNRRDTASARRVASSVGAWRLSLPTGPVHCGAPVRGG